MRSSLRFLAAGTFLLGIAAVACGTDTDPSVFGTGQAGSTSRGGTGGQAGKGGGTAGSTVGGKGGAASEGGTGGTGTGGGIIVGGSGGDPGTGGSESCGGDSVEAKPAPLDLFIMLDQSGSMKEISEGSTTKWAAVKLALGSFMNDPRSVGIGAGLQYFPNQIKAPTSCDNDGDCNGKGTCGYEKVCASPSSGGYAICSTDEACTNQGHPGEKCIPFSQANPAAEKECIGVECKIDTYAAPDVPVTEIPAAINLFAESLKKHNPEGGTPTAPALAGALQYATQWATDHPDHKVAVVLATDGLPTQCEPTNKDLIGEAAKNARPLVDTYVIGVFGKSVDLALVKANLNAIAQGGADRDAFLITTGGNAAKDFADAMATIRTAALPCDFAIPEQSDGKAIDFGKVNVDLTDPDGNVTSLGYAATPDLCDPTTGGWTYDADPAAGGTPTQVKLCPASCDAYRKVAGSKIATIFGCETVIVKPPT